MPDVLSDRALNRATLARQLLLERREMAALDAITHLVGLQAQVPLNPYAALWARLDGFDPHELGGLMESRQVVRIVAIRITIHMVTATDALTLRPITQDALLRELHTHQDHRHDIAEADLGAVLAAAEPFLAEPRTGPQLKAFLAERFPDRSPAALAYACRNLLPVVQVPPRGVWGKAAQVTTATVDGWLGRPVEEPDIDAIVLRYLAAHGPATAADVSTWSSLTGVREVLDRLAPRLRAFTDERGRALVDLPDAPRPGEDVPAPPRFLPEFDNALLSHADRRRFHLDDDRRRRLGDGRAIRGTVLVDGAVGGTWLTEPGPSGDGTTLVVRHLDRLDGATTEAVGAEGLAMLTFLATGKGGPPAPHDVRLERIEG